MTGSAKLCVATLALLALASAAGLPAHALFITSENAVSLAEDNTQFGPVRQDTADTAAGRTIASVDLGDGLNAFVQPAVATAFGAFPTLQGAYSVFLNADNTRNVGDDGLGFARVQLTYKAIKQFGDTAFVLNIVPGRLQLVDGEGQSISLRANVDLNANVFGPTGDKLTGASAHADLTGHEGPFQTDPFNLDSAGLGATLTLQSNGNDVIGATAEWGARQLPLDLSQIVDGTHIEIDVELSGNVFAPGGETIATAFLRDPAHINDPNPLAGASTVTFETASPGPGNPVPEPTTVALLAPALAATWAALGLVRRRR
jgi:hypothetical protein